MENIRRAATLRTLKRFSPVLHRASRRKTLAEVAEGARQRGDLEAEKHLETASEVAYAAGERSESDLNSL